MEWSFVFFLNSALLGVGLAMDAFSVSMANGLHDPKMGKETMCRIAGTFGVFQAVMPMTGWICVHTIVELFSSFETFIPWIALALLGYIGGKMLVDGIKGEEAEEATELSAGALFMQGVATSIDALSVGFTISEYGWLMALAASIIIAVVTFFLCMAGLNIGKKFGTELSGKASILGGVILIGIGLEIFISGIMGISPALYEAAKIEGATAWESFWKITFPMLSPIMVLNAVYSIIDRFIDYNNGVLQYILGFAQKLDFSYSSAMAWLYFLVVGVLVGVVYIIINKRIVYTVE